MSVCAYKLYERHELVCEGTHAVRMQFSIHTRFFNNFVVPRNIKNIYLKK